MLPVVLRSTSRHAALSCRAQRCAAVRYASAASKDESVVIYEGPLNAAVKRIRLVSLTTLATSLMLPPMALIFKSSATVSLMGKVAVGGTAMVAGVGSTAALHFCTLPFVFEMSREGDRIVRDAHGHPRARVTHEFRSR